MTAVRRTTAALAVLGLGLGLGLGACAPIVPQRTKSGGAARWAEALAIPSAFDWARDAQLCRVAGAGVGSDGWLPDRGGQWVFTYWSPTQTTTLFQVTVDTDGRVSTTSVKEGPRGNPLPAGWVDSPRLWSVTRSHWKREPLNTLDAELAMNADPEHFKDQTVWRIRFWMDDSTMETHIVSPDGKWLLSY